MRFFNKIKEVLNPTVIEEFNRMLKSYFYAIDKYIRDDYKPRNIIELHEDKEAFQLYDSKRREIYDFLYRDWVIKYYSADPVKLTYKQKEYLVNHKSEIKDLYKRFVKYVQAQTLLRNDYEKYPHAVAYYCATVLDIYINSIDIPTYSPKVEFCQLDPQIFLENMKKIKGIEELSFLQKKKLLNYRKSFPETEEHILGVMARIELENKFNSEMANEERQIYYRQFLAEKGIINCELISSKQYCLENLAALDSFVKDELVYEDLLDVFGKFEITDFLCHIYKICIEDFNYHINKIPHSDKKFLIENYGDIANFVKGKIHEKYNKLSEEFPLGMESFKQSVDNVIYDYLIIDSPAPIVRENSREWWKEEFRKALTSGCNKYELEIWYKYKDVFAINKLRRKLNEYQKEAEKCEKIREWNKNQFLISTQCLQLKRKFLSEWLRKSEKIKNSSYQNGDNSLKDYYYVLKLICKPFCLDSNFDLSPYPFVAGAGELACTFIGIHPIPNSELTSLGNFLIELNKHYNPISVVFYLGSVNIGKREHILNSYFTVFIRQLLDNGITVCNNLEGLQISENQTVVIIDLVSTIVETNEFLLEFIKKHKDKSPLLSYVSFYHEVTTQNIIKIAQLKEDKENEAIRLKKEKEAELLQEKQSLENCVSSWYDIGFPALKCFSMYNYYPTNCDFEATDEEWKIRQLIWNFKANKGGALSNAKAMRKIVPSTLQCLQYFFGEYLSRLTFVCIPASTQVITKLRYEEFSKEVCRFSGMENGYPHIKVLKDKTTVREGGSFVSGELYDIDDEFFKDKYVILFDDVITRGRSMQVFKQLLEKKGATIIGGFSIGRTKHERLPNNPIDNLVLKKDKYTEYQEKQLKAVLDSLQPPRNECPF